MTRTPTSIESWKATAQKPQAIRAIVVGCFGMERNDHTPAEGLS